MTISVPIWRRPWGTRLSLRPTSRWILRISRVRALIRNFERTALLRSAALIILSAFRPPTSNLKLLIWAMVCSRICTFGAERYVIGVTLVRPAPGCPFFVTEVDKGSPARRGGVYAGDRLVRIGGTPVVDASVAMQLSGTSPKRVVLEIARRGVPKYLTLSTEPESVLFKKRGFRLREGQWWPKWMSKQDIDYRERLDKLLDDRSNVLGTAFAFDHYPRDLMTYYPGFEVFVTKTLGPIVGGMENGPASRAGIRSGDVLVDRKSVV